MFRDACSLRLPLIFLVTSLAASIGNVTGAAQRWSYVDESGVLRWRDDQSEIALFGVNYYTPFTADYEGLARLGEDHRRSIDRDVAHFDQLELDVIRLHVFDRQISDREGNLLENEHLDLFDYLVAVCKRRHIYTVLTPIAWWHYHSPDGGFSSLYTKPEMLTKREARQAQQRYLRQFMEHVNPYTKRAYKDDPAIVAIELINEPLYDDATTVDDVQLYIEDLAEAVRDTGSRQPIFYNGWSNREESVGKSSIEGCSFGWYPTGLVSGGCLRANYLPAVDDYPQMRLPCLEGKAKIVYEFDAADVPGRVMYPAMARAFRSGGAQIATQFQYDPTPLAACNYGWCTHYLNLIYAPGKTVSFAIAAEAFRETPRLAPPGRYPANATFGPFDLDYERDVSVMRTETTFLYANDTDLAPPSPDHLERVAGCGSSPVVRYEGTGAYFLNRLAAGQWLLTVYPDAIWVDDPFAPTSLEREVSRVLWDRHTICVRLPDLGERFQVRQFAPTSGGPLVADAGGCFSVEPGVYALVREGGTIPDHVVHDFWAPRPEYSEPAVWWQAASRWREGVAMPVRVNVAATGIRQVYLQFDGQDGMPLPRIAPYVYGMEVPGDRIGSGTLTARLVVDMADGTKWMSHGTETITELPEPFTLCTIRADLPAEMHDPTGCRAEVVDGKLLRVTSPGFNASGAGGFRLPAEATGQPYDTLVVRARATQEVTDRVEIGLVERDGKAYGTDIPLWPEWNDIRVPLQKLRPLWGTAAGKPDLKALDKLSFVFGAWLYGENSQQAHGYELERVWLEASRPGWKIEVSEADGPLLLFAAGERPVSTNGQDDRHQQLVRGCRPGRQAERIWTNGFGPPPSSISYRQTVSENLSLFLGGSARYDGLEIVVRATQPQTDQMEIALIERDSAAWGTVVPITRQWQPIVVPLDRLRFFGHWAHPQGRGGDQDGLRLDSLSAVNFCFGAWLYGDRARLPHGVEIQSASLVQMR